MRRVAVAILVVASACSGGDGRDDASSTTTTDRDRATAPVPCPEVPATAPPDPDRPRYDLRLALDPAARSLDGRLTVQFTPDLTVDRLVFRLWPNAPRPMDAGGRLDVTEVRLGPAPGRPAETEQPDPTTLVVPLDAPVPARTTVRAAVRWHLTLPGPLSDRLAVEHEGTDVAVRLGSFFPILPWEPGRGWALDPPTPSSLYAEAATSPAADITYSITVPDGLTVLGTGRRRGDRWHATAVRDVGLSVGRFTVVERTARAPRPVRVVVGAAAGSGEDATAYLDRVVPALEDYARRFGPYPWPTFTLAVTPGLVGGIEFPTFVMQGPGSNGRVTPHEVAHQWFYSLVGNDQAQDPWLDEALATYAEATYDDELTGDRAAFIPPAGRDRVGAPTTYWDGHPGAYFLAVYVQGSVALADTGPLDAVDCGLRHYVADRVFTIARPADLVRALEVAVPGAGADLRRRGAG